MVANDIYDPVLNKTYYDYGKDDNSSMWYGQNEVTLPIWILNELKSDRNSAIIGHFPGADVPFLNRTVSFSRDYDNKLDWYKKVDSLVELFMEKDKKNRINFGVLYFTEPDETGHQFGPYSGNLKAILNKIDMIVGYLIEKLINNNLFDRMSKKPLFK
jgi:ectonucleotide pyrophosphatase/phosphodiesterase family member 5